MVGTRTKLLFMTRKLHMRLHLASIIFNNLFNQRLTDRRLVYTTASHRYERCWSGASRLPTARSSLQAAYSQHSPCGALVPAEAGPNFAAWWAGVHVCEQLTQGCYAVCLGRGPNSRPSDRQSRTLTIEPPRHKKIIDGFSMISRSSLERPCSDDIILLAPF